ncbi:hypothetical protein WV31_09805 [Magnetospirillum sp. ME-1]|uniref:DUF5677 domain-containing protein n=1 Tax=Magnetospirillum sp. ME-1 TaxID=1639348 RepID=UPI000A17CAD0|nr:DUF5677 domain-containing protein [Magnetospirillum sp. ME-1]ARJ65928.1 hypothetical protein WV31_09805 [Magnetospirillum sp. ME-1]
MAEQDDDSERGFLGERGASTIPVYRMENADWFQLADEVNVTLMRLATWAVNSVKTSSMAPEAVAVRVLLRSCGMYQGVIMLTERGMVAEGRTLTRALIENAFGIAALVDKPQEFMDMLREDSEASGQNQRKFLLAEDLIASGATRDKLQAASSGRRRRS